MEDCQFQRRNSRKQQGLQFGGNTWQDIEATASAFDQSDCRISSLTLLESDDIQLEVAGPTGLPESPLPVDSPSSTSTEAALERDSITLDAQEEAHEGVDASAWEGLPEGFEDLSSRITGITLNSISDGIELEVGHEAVAQEVTIGYDCYLNVPPAAALMHEGRQVHEVHQVRGGQGVQQVQQVQRVQDEACGAELCTPRLRSARSGGYFVSPCQEMSHLDVGPTLHRLSSLGPAELNQQSACGTPFGATPSHVDPMYLRLCASEPVPFLPGTCSPCAVDVEPWGAVGVPPCGVPPGGAAQDVGEWSGVSAVAQARGCCAPFIALCGVPGGKGRDAQAVVEGKAQAMDGNRLSSPACGSVCDSTNTAHSTCGQGVSNCGSGPGGNSSSSGTTATTTGTFNTNSSSSISSASSAPTEHEQCKVFTKSPAIILEQRRPSSAPGSKNGESRQDSCASLADSLPDNRDLPAAAAAPNSPSALQYLRAAGSPSDPSTRKISARNGSAATQNCLAQWALLPDKSKPAGQQGGVVGGLAAEHVGLASKSLRQTKFDAHFSPARAGEGPGLAASRQPFPDQACAKRPSTLKREASKLGVACRNVPWATAMPVLNFLEAEETKRDFSGVPRSFTSQGHCLVAPASKPAAWQQPKFIGSAAHTVCIVTPVKSLKGSSQMPPHRSASSEKIAELGACKQVTPNLAAPAEAGQRNVLKGSVPAAVSPCVVRWAAAMPVLRIMEAETNREPRAVPRRSTCQVDYSASPDTNKASIPTSIGSAVGTASRPTPIDPAASTASRPTPIGPAASTASRPTPIAPAATTASRPTPIGPAATTASRPTPIGPVASTATRTTAIGSANRTSLQPTFIGHAARSASQPKVAPAVLRPTSITPESKTVQHPTSLAPATKPEAQVSSLAPVARTQLQPNSRTTTPMPSLVRWSLYGRT